MNVRIPCCVSIGMNIFCYKWPQPQPVLPLIDVLLIELLSCWKSKLVWQKGRGGSPTSVHISIHPTSSHFVTRETVSFSDHSPNIVVVLKLDIKFDYSTCNDIFGSTDVHVRVLLRGSGEMPNSIPVYHDFKYHHPTQQRQ
jgi:hypothetical protein